MTTLEAWLAAMPPVREVDARIDQLEAELRKLQLIKKLQNGGATRNGRSSNGHTNGNGHSADRSLFEPVHQPGRQAEAVIDPARLSADRRAILEIMLSLRNGQAPLRVVAHKMRTRGIQVDDKHVGANMARMYKAGLLHRIKQGVYVVPDHVADYIRETSQQGAGVVMR